MPKTSSLPAVPGLLRRTWRAVFRIVGILPLTIELRRLAAHPERPLTERTILRLTLWWSNNRGTAAGTRYLMELQQRCQEVEGPVLECGSGLSTLLAAIYSQQPVRSLEQLPKWRKRVVRIGRFAGLPVQVDHAPLIDHGGYEWYLVSDDLPARFALVICDGPPGWTRGGRSGLLPVMVFSLGGAVVMLDDTDRPQERNTALQWCQEWGLQIALDAGEYMVLQVPTESVSVWAL